MKRMLRTLSGLVLLGIGALSVASIPVGWQQDHPYRSFSKLTRDASGYVYCVSREVFGTGSVLYAEKFAPNGTRLWENAYLLSNLPILPEIRSATVDNGRLYVVMVERSASTNVIQKSRLLAYSQGSGDVVYSKSANDGSVYSFASSNNTHVALLLKNASDSGVVEFLNSANGSSAGTVNLGNVSGTREVRIDASGNAYTAANNTNGSVQVARCSAAGGLAYQTTLSSAPRTNGDLLRLEFDTANSRVYGLAAFDWSPTDDDVLLFSVDSASGAAASPQVVGGSTENEKVGDLRVVADGVLLSTIVPSTNSSVVMKRSTTGSAVWSRVLTDTRDIFNRPIGIDVDGNVLVLSSSYPQGFVQFDRVNSANGTVLDRRTYFPDTFSLYPTDMRMDSAGNAYILGNHVYGSRLIRLQPAELTFTANNIPGGGTTVGRVSVAIPPTVDEVWTLSSSNPGVASVPSTVTVVNNTSSQTFQIATSPVAAITNVSINARHNGFVCQQTLTVLPSTVNNLTLSPQVVKGGLLSTGTVTLRGKAIVGGLTVWLSSNKTLVASIPGSIVVPEGADQATFPITTYGVNSNQGVVITATTGAVSKTAFFAVNAPSLQSIAVSPGSLKGGVSGSLTVTLDGIAPTGGFSIVLFSGAPGIVTLPASASVSPNQTERTIGVPTAAVTSAVNVTLIATRSGIYKTTTLTVNP